MVTRTLAGRRHLVRPYKRQTMRTRDTSVSA
jgi:hypothetical protein